MPMSLYNEISRDIYKIISHRYWIESKNASEPIESLDETTWGMERSPHLERLACVCILKLIIEWSNRTLLRIQRMCAWRLGSTNTNQVLRHKTKWIKLTVWCLKQQRHIAHFSDWHLPNYRLQASKSNQGNNMEGSCEAVRNEIHHSRGQHTSSNQSTKSLPVPMKTDELPLIYSIFTKARELQVPYMPSTFSQA